MDFGSFNTHNVTRTIAISMLSFVVVIALLHLSPRNIMRFAPLFKIFNLSMRHTIQVPPPVTTIIAMMPMFGFVAAARFMMMFILTAAFS